jgi:hypothetical protein
MLRINLRRAAFEAFAKRLVVGMSDPRASHYHFPAHPLESLLDASMAIFVP